VVSPVVRFQFKQKLLRHNRLKRVPFTSDQLATEPRGKAPGKLLIRMMRGEAGGTLEPHDRISLQKKPRHSGASRWEERRPKKDKLFLS
jgi:hypothetical protein